MVMCGPLDMKHLTGSPKKKHICGQPEDSCHRAACICMPLVQKALMSWREGQGLRHIWALQVRADAGTEWTVVCREPQEAVAGRPLAGLSPSALIGAELGQRGHGAPPELVFGARQGANSLCLAFRPFVSDLRARGLHEVAPGGLESELMRQLLGPTSSLLIVCQGDRCKPRLS